MHSEISLKQRKQKKKLMHIFKLLNLKMPEISILCFLFQIFYVYPFLLVCDKVCLKFHFLYQK